MNRSSLLLLVPALLVAAPTPKVLTPAMAVERQLEAINAHDLEGVLALFSEDAEVSDLPVGAPALKGKSGLRERYTGLFKGNPELHVSAAAQLVSGAFVVQRERLKGLAGSKGPVEVVMVYQVKSSRIIRMWALRE
ncbi:MAG: SnoaL-like domain-containing protein [Holophagaceae bacterium]|nr:SnoaL-like domain-containing protein [Holophagaceae bacterium]